MREETKEETPLRRYQDASLDPVDGFGDPEVVADVGEGADEVTAERPKLKVRIRIPKAEIPTETDEVEEPDDE